MADVVVIEAALNGGRTRDEHPGVPLTAAEIAAEAQRCAEAGASVVHVHARGRSGGWTASPLEYRRVVRAVRAAAPDVLVSITSLRPQDVAVERVQALLAEQSPDALPDLISVNLGHITTWEARPSSPNGESGYGARGRETRQYPNSYDDIALLLGTCRNLGITPELGLMDFGFISNAVALREDGLLPASPWFLLELDSPTYGAGAQVAPASAPNYTALAAALREQFPSAPWAAHGAVSRPTPWCSERWRMAHMCGLASRTACKCRMVNWRGATRIRWLGPWSGQGSWAAGQLRRRRHGRSSIRDSDRRKPAPCRARRAR